MMFSVATVLSNLLNVVGLTVLSGVVATVISLGYRWYVRKQIPAGVTLLGGVAAVALYLNTRGALGAVAQGEVGYLSLEAIVFNTVAFITAGAITPVGRRAGDWLAANSVALAGSHTVDGELSQVVKSVGRLTAVTLPEQIADIEGYDPIAESTKRHLSGRTLLFPRRLTVEELRDRLITRLKADYDVGYVDIDLTPDASVEYLGVGSRIAGLGPTLAPGTGAVAVTADPPQTAGQGDLVQVWDTTGDQPKRRAIAEIRGVAGDVTTLALDEHDGREIASGDYRLVTVPVEPRTEREFAGLLRAADETMSVIEVDTDADLAGMLIRDVEATVVAVKPSEKPIVPIPGRSRRIEVGDLVYVVARPDVIRRLEGEGDGEAPP